MTWQQPNSHQMEIGSGEELGFKYFPIIVLTLEILFAPIQGFENCIGVMSLLGNFGEMQKLGKFDLN